MNAPKCQHEGCERECEECYGGTYVDHCWQHFKLEDWQKFRLWFDLPQQTKQPKKKKSVKGE